jgi:Ca-activated chloride channel family protein
MRLKAWGWKHRAVFGVPVLIVLAGNARPVTQEPDTYKLSVNVNLVVVDAAVRDRKGRSVSDLDERNFAIYEDGVRQSIRLFLHEDIPVAAGLVIDHSGSMRAKLPDVIAGARTFVQTSNPEDRLFVVNFNEKVMLGLSPAVGFTNRSRELEHAISTTPAEGMTALYDALIKALEQLHAGQRDKKVLLVISDGGDNASSHKLTDVLKLAAQSRTMIYTIGIFEPEDPDKNPEALRHLAAATGGEAFFPHHTSEVEATCQRIAHDIRNQYTIGYVSAAAPRPGVYRAIRVVAGGTADGKLSVRARSGYIAGEITK